MNQLIQHRGPDDQGVYVDKHISLGNVRLAIVDVSKKGHMPMVSKSGRYVITYNGEIYNFKRLRKHLIQKGYTFRSKTDTEVILNLYAEYGHKAFLKLNGMFAIAIWDKLTQTLTLARDRVGIKPLYFTIQNNQLIFSSEIKSFRSHQTTFDLDQTSLQLYTKLLYVPAPYTIFKNIHKLQPGETLIWENGKASRQFFWQPQPTSQFANMSVAIKKIRSVTHDAVRKQLVADRPVGIFLSGGIDSTTILALATKIHGRKIDTFSIGFSDVAQIDKFNADFYLARQSAQYYGSNHHEFIISPQQALEDFIALSSHMDEPIANATHIPTYCLARETRKTGIVVALGGDGGDELFGGYDRYRDAWLLDLYQQLPSLIRTKFIEKFVQKIKSNPSPDLISNLNSKTLAEKYCVFMGQPQSTINSIYNYPDKSMKSALHLRGLNKLSDYSFHQAILWLDFMNWLSEESLMRSDKMTMAWSLEQRVPLLDNRLIDIALKIPFSWKVGPKTRKKILRQSFSDILPEFIVNAPKRGFFSPGAKWLRHRSWKELLAEHFSTSSLKKSGVYKPRQTQKMLTDHIKGKKYNLPLLWAVLQFQVWYAYAMKTNT